MNLPRIEELESRLSKDLSEATFNELKSSKNNKIKLNYNQIQ